MLFHFNIVLSFTFKLNLTAYHAMCQVYLFLFMKLTSEYTTIPMANARPRNTHRPYLITACELQL